MTVGLTAPAPLCIRWRMETAVAKIYRYPVKGLSAQDLPEVVLSPGEGLPDDRRFAITHGASAFDPTAPEWRPKTDFLNLSKNERLAATT